MCAVVSKLPNLELLHDGTIKRLVYETHSVPDM